jgi:hypothetical protein
MFYTRGAINMALALPASPPFNREVLLDTTAGKDGGGNGDPLGNKEGEDWQLEGQGGGGSNQTKKTKVRAFSLELYATMPYKSAFVVGVRCGSLPFKAQQRPPQEVVRDWHPGGYYLFSLSVLS